MYHEERWLTLIMFLQRHRLVNEVLAHELKNGVHALAIVAKCPAEWKDEPVESSPNCQGGFRKWTTTKYIFLIKFFVSINKWYNNIAVYSIVSFYSTELVWMSCYNI